MEKLKYLLTSRKFWATIAAIVTVAAAYFTNQIDPWQAVQGVIAALAAYAVGTGLDNGTPAS